MTHLEEGTKFDLGKPRMDLIPVHPLIDLGALYAFGAHKYEDRNWEKGMQWSRLYAAAMRHLTAFWGGEDIDPETGLPHVIAVAFNVFALAEFMRTHPELDDRP